MQRSWLCNHRLCTKYMYLTLFIATKIDSSPSLQLQRYNSYNTEQIDIESISDASWTFTIAVGKRRVRKFWAREHLIMRRHAHSNRVLLSYLPNRDKYSIQSHQMQQYSKKQMNCFAIYFWAEWVRSALKIFAILLKVAYF